MTCLFGVNITVSYLNIKNVHFSEVNVSSTLDQTKAKLRSV